MAKNEIPGNQPEEQLWRACPTCKTTGSITVNRGGKTSQRTCPKCHGHGYILR